MPAARRAAMPEGFKPTGQECSRSLVGWRRVESGRLSHTVTCRTTIEDKKAYLLVF